MRINRNSELAKDDRSSEVVASLAAGGGSQAGGALCARPVRSLERGRPGLCQRSVPMHRP